MANPTASLILYPTASPTQYCFPNRATLKFAVDLYISEGCETNNPSCATRSQYGVIGTWCVKHVTDMNELFYAASSFKSFNSNISNWNVGAVTTWRACSMGHQALIQTFQVGMCHLRQICMACSIRHQASIQTFQIGMLGM
jgi:hypothetical protein